MGLRKKVEDTPISPDISHSSPPPLPDEDPLTFSVEDPSVKEPLLPHRGSREVRSDSVLELMILHPEYSEDDLAKIFGVTLAWMTQLIRTDLFQVKLAERREDVTKRGEAAIAEMLTGITTRSLEMLKLVFDSGQVTPKFALDVSDKFLRRMGYGQRKDSRSPATQVTVNVGLAPADVINEAREAAIKARLTHKTRDESLFIEGEAVES